MHAERPPYAPRAPGSGSSERGAGLERVDALLARLRPLDDTGALEARVLRRIGAAGGVPSATPRRTTAVWVGVGIAALAATAVGAWLASSESGQAHSAQAHVAASRAGQSAQRLAETATPPAPVDVLPEARTSPESAKAIAPPSASPVAPRARAAPAPVQAEPASTQNPPESLLYAAAAALRRDRDPARALELLVELRKEAPGLGAREDARALEVEAHHRIGSPRTRTLAEAYLRDFPSGRFRATAENVLGGARGGE